MPPITPSTADQAGLSRSGLYRGADAGKLVRIARGIYLHADAPATDWSMVEAATRRPHATICLASALAHHDLIDAIPATLDIAIPRGARPPATEQAITWHQFDAGTFELGRSEMRVEGAKVSIGLYSPERCIADAFRLRGQLGYEIARDSLKEWLRRGGKPSHLMQIALQLPRAKAPVLRALKTLS